MYTRQCFCWLIRVSLFIELGGAGDLGTRKRGAFSTFKISRPILHGSDWVEILILEWGDRMHPIIFKNANEYKGCEGCERCKGYKRCKRCEGCERCEGCKRCERCEEYKAFKGCEAGTKGCEVGKRQVKGLRGRYKGR